MDAAPDIAAPDKGLADATNDLAWGNSDKYVVKMAVFAGAGLPPGELDAKVPFHYFVARGGAAWGARQVQQAIHSQSKFVTFDDPISVDATTLIGAYVPTGHVARYRYAFTDKHADVCDVATTAQYSPWTLYSLPGKPDRAAIEPLHPGGKEIPSKLDRNHCLNIQWLLNKIPSATYAKTYGGTYADLYEQPTIAVNGQGNLSQSDTLEISAPGAKGGGFRLGVAESFGGVAKSLEIRSGSAPYVSILVNGAPTDDGLVWGIPLYEAAGLYGANDAPVSMGSSQFVGHNAHGTTFGNSMWGLQVPLTLKGGASYKYLETPAGLCGATPCFFPMYSDFSKAASSAANECNPFFRQTSAHPWDGRISRIAAGILKQPDNTSSPVARLMYHFEYRPHLKFTAKGGYKPHLWFNQSLKNRIRVHLINKNDQVSTISYDDLFRPNGLVFQPNNRYAPPTAQDFAVANQKWLAFCNAQDGAKFKCTHKNPNQNNDMSCQCSLTSYYKRVVFEYLDHDVAIALTGTGSAFEHLYIGTVFRTQLGYTPFILISASNNDQRGVATTFDPASFLKEDRFFFSVGTLQDLNDMDLGATTSP